MKKEPKRITLGLVLGYIVGVVTLIIGLAVIVLSFFGGLLIILSGLIIFPPFIRYVEKELNVHLSIWLKLIAFLILFIIGMVLVVPSNNTNQESANQAAKEKNTSDSTDIKEEPTLSISEIKQVAIKVIYDDLIRNNEDYVGKIVYYKGEILQVNIISTDKYVLLVSVTNKGLYWDDVVWIKYQGKRFLEKDIIDIWGDVDGLKTYKSTSGAITVPEIDALQIELVEKAEDRF